MPRIVKEEEYAVKRNEILDVAQRFIYTKGYEQMTIQDILGELQISKGAFYHYFDSKGALIEALVERMIDEGEKLLTPIVQDPHLSALEKFQQYFETAARWKTAQKTYLLALMRGWYNDHNAIVRQKLFEAVVKRVSPLFTLIIRQGIQEGVFKPDHPDYVAEVVLSLFQSFGDTITRLILSLQQELDDLQRSADSRRIENIIAAYTDALERVLGAPTGSLELIDADTLMEWVVVPRETVPG